MTNVEVCFRVFVALNLEPVDREGRLVCPVHQDAANAMAPSSAVRVSTKRERKQKERKKSRFPHPPVSSSRCSAGRRGVFLVCHTYVLRFPTHRPWPIKNWPVCELNLIQSSPRVPCLLCPNLVVLKSNDGFHRLGLLALRTKKLVEYTPISYHPTLMFLECGLAGGRRTERNIRCKHAHAPIVLDERGLIYDVSTPRRTTGVLYAILVRGLLPGRGNTQRTTNTHFHHGARAELGEYSAVQYSTRVRTGPRKL